MGEPTAPEPPAVWWSPTEKRFFAELWGAILAGVWREAGTTLPADAVRLVPDTGASKAVTKRADITDEQVVRACVTAHENSLYGPLSLDVLIAETGAPLRVAQAAMTRAKGRGLIECGVSERTSWATPAGRALLGTEEIDRG